MDDYDNRERDNESDLDSGENNTNNGEWKIVFVKKMIRDFKFKSKLITWLS